MASRLHRVLVALSLPAIVTIVTIYWARKRKQRSIASSQPHSSSTTTKLQPHANGATPNDCNHVTDSTMTLRNEPVVDTNRSPAITMLEVDLNKMTLQKDADKVSGDHSDKPALVKVKEQRDSSDEEPATPVKKTSPPSYAKVVQKTAERKPDKVSNGTANGTTAVKPAAAVNATNAQVDSPETPVAQTVVATSTPSSPDASHKRDAGEKATTASDKSPEKSVLDKNEEPVEHKQSDAAASPSSSSGGSLDSSSSERKGDQTPDQSASNDASYASSDIQSEVGR